MWGFYDIPTYIIKIVQEHDEGDQIRKHKKKRINKKWLKRYGCYGKQKLDKGQVIFVDGTVYMSRPYFRKLKKELNWKIKTEFDLKDNMTKQDIKLFERTTIQPRIVLASPDSEFEVSQVCEWDYDIDKDGNVVNLHLNGVHLERVK